MSTPGASTSAGEETLPIFGQIVLERGLARREEIESCIRDQEERAAAGDFVRLGQVFVQNGILTPSQVQDVLSSQKVQIQVCDRCRTQYNRTSGDPSVSRECPRCGGSLVDAPELDSTAVEDTLTADQVEEEAEREQGLRILHGGTRSFGPFEIIGEISRGGMGIVYKARERGLERIVALKVLLAGGESALEDIDRFEREARAVAQLRHPSIIEIHRIGVHQGIHYYTMNYIQGINLDKVLEQDRLDLDTRVLIVARIADAVDYAHRNGVLHRDIKPSNILVDQKMDPYLIDFGIAKIRDESSEMTRSGIFLGSPQYMAPEYIAGNARASDVRSDIYALGMTLYKVLTGKLPYPDGDTIQILQQVLAGAPRLEEHVRDLPRDLGLICLKAIERDPDQRYQTAGRMADDLRRTVRGDEVSVRPRGHVFHLRRWVRDRASLVFNVALSLSLVLVFWALHATARHHADRADELQRQMNEAQRQGLEMQYEILVERGARHLAEGRPEEAIVVLDRAAALLPKRAEAYRVRRHAHLAVGDEAAAEADRLRVVGLERPGS